ncbi:unnamed protein product (macronuclear) [Paramecium tetraurelia]|uniref:non-specific serine/threonine protein kinase n=1 Tax=Paramecium tetraurelia TaxID=5888 RepID=A0EHS2_PARTE|nr:uncharacterized protein GSPATT00027189001 [Paramecium tetraurelia]CAK94863.1 unnamed protein product [Paramecium tetraurelia]|eukprot:XP_001462236.1 hypothetical protein (macronuclear) [Paramecium tetraurelia strain d4-2]
MQGDLRINLDFQEQESFYSDEDEEEEGIKNYQIGRFHPVFIGEVFHGRYVVIQKLGYGNFSTVWLAKDFKTNTFVALKIQRSAPQSQEAALDEIEILQTIQRKSRNINIVKLLNVFVHKGIFGNHYVLIFEILGQNLLELIRNCDNDGLNLEQCKSIIKQILIALDFLHRECGIIHTDLKPENILLCLTTEQIKDIVEKGQIKQRQYYSEQLNKYSKLSKSDKKKEKRKRQKEKKKLQSIKYKLQQIDSNKRIFQIKIADFGNACWVNHHMSEVIQTQKYRAPEVILGQYYGTSADIWSLACIAFELVTGDSLFDTEFEDYDTHLKQIQEILGPFPIEFTSVGKYRRSYFKHDGELRNVKVKHYCSLQQLLVKKYQMENFEAAQFADFLLPMLNVFSYKRATASQMLKHPWISKQQFKFHYFIEVPFIDNEHEVNSESDDEDLEKADLQ